MTTTELRESARLIWKAALNAASPATCIRNFIELRDGALWVRNKMIPIRGRLIVVGCGKASASMAQAVENILGPRVSTGLVVTKHGHALPLDRIRLHEAGHPIPDASGVEAVRETRALLTNLSADDVVLCL